MKRSHFRYELPERQIALRPVRPRSASRMLLVAGDSITDRLVHDLPTILRPGDRLVFNDTRVVPARLHALRASRRADGPRIPISLTLERQLEGGLWRAIGKPMRRLKVGDHLHVGRDLTAILRLKERETCILEFNLAGAALDTALAAVGELPLPHYIASLRSVDRSDDTDYQTIFASRPGAVAAPTAALHFDALLLAALREQGIALSMVTLHVGMGTFLPIRCEHVEEHRMHAEWGCIDAQVACDVNETRRRGGRVIAVGTTALRLLEAAARDGEVGPWSGDTDIYIRPGHRFRAIDGLMTNFHAPESSLLVLVAALIGVDRMREAYRHALTQGYRFLSYGDSSLLLPGG